MPGRDLWDNKLPLIYLIGRAAMATGHPKLYLWLFEAALTALGACAVARIVEECSADQAIRRAAASDRPNFAALAGGAALCVVSGEPSFHAGGFQTEVYAMPLSALAVMLLLKAMAGGSRFANPAAAGLLWTIAVSFRLPLGLAAVGVTAVVLLLVNRGRRVRFASLTVLGVAAGVAVVFAHPLLAGYLRECVECAVLWPLDWHGRRIPGPLVPSTADRLKDCLQDVLKLAWLHVPAVAGYVVAVRKGLGRLMAPAIVWYAAAMASSAWGVDELCPLSIRVACAGLSRLGAARSISAEPTRQSGIARAPVDGGAYRRRADRAFGDQGSVAARCRG